MDYKIQLNHIRENCCLTKIPNDANAFLVLSVINNLWQEEKASDSLIILENDVEVARFIEQVNFFKTINQFDDVKLLTFPAWDCNPLDFISPKPNILSARINCLYKLANRDKNSKFIVAVSVNSMLQKTINQSELNNIGLYLKIGKKISIQQLVNFLMDSGYERQASANNVGDFALRGGIVDIILQEAGDLSGYRIDFFGEEIDSIKLFDPITQITNSEVKTLQILPASELLLNKRTAEIFKNKYRELFGNSTDNQLYNALSQGRQYHGMEHFLPLFYNSNLVNIIEHLKQPVIFNNTKNKIHFTNREKEVKEAYESRIEALSIKEKNIEKKHLQPIAMEMLYFKENELQKIISNYLNIEFSSTDENENIINQERIIDLEMQITPDFAMAGRINRQEPLELLNNFINQHNFKIVVIACLSESSKERMVKMMADFDINFQEIDNFPIKEYKTSNYKAKKILIAKSNFVKGFYNKDFAIISEQMIFGEKIIRRRSSKIDATRLIEEGLAIKQGEIVVHRDYGIGRFEGIEKINAGNTSCEMLKIAFGGNDLLFVAVDEINLISRYGSDNPLIELDRLGGATWKNRKTKIRQKIKIAAETLLKTAVKRQLTKAPILVPDRDFYNEFCNDFGFIETDDQIRAIEEVEEDLQKGTLMDRLICGDVGFGKTEVAIRATAIAINGSLEQGGQVAIIAPTTLLCRQHFKNLSQRFAKYDIKVAQLSRLVTPAEAKKIKEQIASGEVKIVIGTHSLLQKDIKFHNLVLAIIDEEQHFGVAQKEKLKELHNSVHLLTLSATPIPRTLQMSLTGVKDLSLISTPPIDRLAVRNFVMQFDNVVVKEAILREYNRGGKSFFVVPRIRDLEEMAPKLKELFPDLKIEVANGQMPANQIEKIIADFIEGKIDVLLSTTIIESGLDIANANSIIVYKAEAFGMAQLYQLRGRVGRAKIRGYAYFMTSKAKIADDAKKKLEIMQNLDALGVGFTIASCDMDIRGSGDLLGDDQSGHIKETGVELYQQMLIEEIARVKNIDENHQASGIANKNNLEEDFIPQIKLAISLLIPSDYIEDLQLRMSFYKKISLIKNNEDKENIESEIIDRFGKIPETVANLIAVALLKNKCQYLGIGKIEAINEGLVISFYNDKLFNSDILRDNLFKMIFSSNNKIRFYQSKNQGTNQPNNQAFKGSINNATAKINHQKILFTQKFIDDKSKIEASQQAMQKLSALLN